MSSEVGLIRNQQRFCIWTEPRDRLQCKGLHHTPRDSFVRLEQERFSEPLRDIDSADRTLPILMGLFCQLKATGLADRMPTRCREIAILGATSLAIGGKGLEADWTVRHGWMM